LLGSKSQPISGSVAAIFTMVLLPTDGDRWLQPLSAGLPVADLDVCGKGQAREGTGSVWGPLQRALDNRDHRVSIKSDKWIRRRERREACA
jgi:hypothetical protein